MPMPHSIPRDDASRDSARTGRGPSPEKTARTRATLLAAAMAEFIEKGFAAATIAGVAKRAGVAKGTVYTYFRTREEMFAGIVRDIARSPLERAIRKPIQAHETIATYFRRTILPAMREIECTGRASVAQLVMTDGPRFPILSTVYRNEVYNPFLDHVRTYGQMGFARGEAGCELLIRHPHLLIAPVWTGIVQNCIMDPGNPVDIAQIFSVHLDLIFGPV